MVYKIRNKGFDIFAAATNPRVFPAKKTKIGLDLTRLVTFQVQQTRFTGMRIKHGYRNISRSCKQFLMGDKLLEQAVILTIKEHFFRPMYYQSPIENSFYIVSAQETFAEFYLNGHLTILLISGPCPRRLDRQALLSVRQQPAPAPVGHLQLIQPYAESHGLGGTSSSPE